MIGYFLGQCISFTYSFLLSEVVVLSVVCSVPNNLAADDSSGAVVVGDTVVASNNWNSIFTLQGTWRETWTQQNYFHFLNHINK